MQKAKWVQVNEIYDRAIELAPDKREPFVNKQSQDPEVTQAVLRLLRTAELQTGFMATGGGIDESLVTLEPGKRLGAWTVKSSIGAGGMGEVYLVERSDGHFDKVAALKLISSSSPDVWERFSVERQVLADLEHPGIGRLIDGGVADDGRPFLVMEHIIGQTLAVYAKDRNLNERARLSLVQSLCQSLSHAHERLILHRDVKPDNILVADSGELKLIDFGIAELLSSETKETNAPMTFAYAAPEQLSGEEVTVRTDVFGAGMTLHELLTDEIPKRNGLGVDVAKSVSNPELRTILNKALAEDPAARYRSTEMLSLDIERYLSYYPVGAMADTRGYRFAKFFKRNRASVLLGGATFAALVAGIIGTSLQTAEANRQRAVAEVEAEKADERSEVTEVAVRMFSELTGQAIAAQEEGNLDFPVLMNNIRDKAISDLDEDPASARNILYTLSEIHSKREDTAAVLETLRPIYDATTDREDYATAQSLMQYGFVSGQAGDIETASKALDRANAIMSKSPERYAFNLVNLQSLRAQYSQDPETVEQILKKLSETVDEYLEGNGGSENDAVFLLSQIAFIHFQRGEPTKALPLIERALEVNQNISGAKATPDEQLLFPLIRIYSRMGRFEEAAIKSAALIKVVEDTSGPSRRLASRSAQHAEILQKLDRHDEAQILLEKAYVLYGKYEPSPSQGAISSGLSWALSRAKLGFPDEALERLEAERLNFHEAIEKGGFFRFAYFDKSGDVFEALGQTDKARAAYTAALLEKDSPDMTPPEIMATQAKLEALP